MFAQDTLCYNHNAKITHVTAHSTLNDGACLFPVSYTHLTLPTICSV